MPSIRLDHFITYTDAVTIDDHVAGYRKAGFAVPDRTVRHDPGLRTGFVGFGPEYLEFCWVEDEDLFSKGEADQHAFREALRPWGIGIVTDDVHALHDDWTARGYDVPPVWSKAPRDAPPESPPVWSFQEIPADLLPGSSCFALTYHTRSADTMRKVRPAPNTTYAIAGLTFVSTVPEARARRWRDLLAPRAPIHAADDQHEVPIGPHVAIWMTPDAYQRTYERTWDQSPHPYGDLAVLHLLSTGLNQASAMLERAGRHVARLRESRTGGEMLLVWPDPHDGFVFAITERPLEDWLRERTAMTGEQLEYADADPWS